MREEVKVWCPFGGTVSGTNHQGVHLGEYLKGPGERE